MHVGIRNQILHVLDLFLLFYPEKDCFVFVWNQKEDSCWADKMLCKMYTKNKKESATIQHNLRFSFLKLLDDFLGLFPYSSHLEGILDILLR